MWVHPTEDVVLVQRSVGGALKDGFVSGLTYGLVDTDKDPTLFKAAASWLVKPVGCQLTTIRAVDKATSYEMAYACPAGVDLRALVRAQTPTLRDGAPLHP